jgi:hypothetical protein
MADLLMMADPSVIQTAATTTGHVAHAVAGKCPVVAPQVITEQFIPWSYYMYSVIAGAVFGLVTGVIGYFVGARGLKGTQTDLTNAATSVSNAASQIKAAV